MKQVLRQAIALQCVATALGSTMLFSQATRGDWPVSGGDPGQSRWQKAESRLSPESISGNFKLLFKLQLGKPADVGSGFTEPLLAPRLINAQGFKDIVYWTSRDTLYAVDSELGNLLWTRHFGGAPNCSLNLSTLIEPPAVINFAARRPAGAPVPVQPPPLAPSERRLGLPPGGGGFGLRGIYVLTGDGTLHEQVLTTGADFAEPVKFLAGNGASALNISGKTVFATSAQNCPTSSNGLWSIDIGQPTYPVAHVSMGGVRSLALAGPAVAPDATAFLITGPGVPDQSTAVYPDSVLAYNKDLKLRDWYTSPKATQTIQNVSPATFPYKGRQYVVAPTQTGSFVLLDAASLGGSDHHTPLAETAAFTAIKSKHPWDGFATWLDKSGTAWVFASISAPINATGKSASTHGSTPHGAIVAFRINDADQRPVLNPVWISSDMLNPAPPVAANGVLIALAGGDSKTHATLFVLDAGTGKELFTSGDTIPTYTHFSGLAVGDGHAFFADHAGTLYSFGIGLEH